MGYKLHTEFGVDRVVSMHHRVIYRGLYNPQKESELIIVRFSADKNNGTTRGAVVASTYTGPVRPSSAHATLATLRALD